MVWDSRVPLNDRKTYREICHCANTAELTRQTYKEALEISQMRENGGQKQDSRDENKYMDSRFVLLRIIIFYTYLETHKIV